MSQSLTGFLRRHPDFTRFWSASILINLGAQIEAVTIGWQIYIMARDTMSVAQSAYLVGMVGLAQFLPLFALTLFAGILADRKNRRMIVMAALAVEIICVLGLIWVALEDTPRFTHIFVIAAFFGAARAFYSPAASAVTPMLVPKPEMPQAISLKSLAWQGAVIVGPWLGGILCAFSVASAYAVACLLYVAGFAILLLIRHHTRPERRPGRVWAQLKEGVAYTWHNKIVFGAISLDLAAVLLGSAVSLLPAFANDILHVGAQGFGILRSGPAVGASVMAVALARYPLKAKAGQRMFLAVGAFGLATIVFGLSRNMWISVAALAALGAADMVSVYVRQTLVQVVTPDHMRGRVASVSGLFISGSNELGEFESGVVSRFIGPVAATVVGGIGTVMVTGLWAWMFPALRRADRLDTADEVPSPIPPHSATSPASPQ